MHLINEVFLNTDTAIIDEDDDEISFNLKEGTPILIVNKESAKKRKIPEESQDDSMIDIVSELEYVIITNFLTSYLQNLT